MDSIVIIGYGGLAREIAQYIQDINVVNPKWILQGYCGKSHDLLGTSIGKHNIIMDDDSLIHTQQLMNVVIGSGFPNIISKIHESMSLNDNLSFANVIHPKAYIGSIIPSESGVIVCPGAVISIDVDIGRNNVFNWNCTIGHDVITGDFCVFNPSCNISGSTEIGSRVLVGTGAQVLQGLSICDDVIIGAGAVVTKDITEPGVYVGMPARRIK